MLLIFIASVIIILFYFLALQFPKIFVELSPSFDNQQIYEPDEKDWELYSDTYYNPAKNISECKSKADNFPSPDLIGADYISDGNVLNATLWLSEPFIEPIGYPYRENIQVDIENLDNYTSLEQYVNDTIYEYNHTIKDFRIIEYNTNKSFANMPSYELIWNETVDNNTSLKSMQIGTLNGNKLYSLNYYARVEKFSGYLPVVQKIANLFKIDDISAYKSPSSGISIEYPSNWNQIDQNGDNFESTLGSTYSSSVQFFSPFESKSDLFAENLLIVVENLPLNSNISSNDYMSEVIRQTETYSNFKIIESAKTTLSAYPANKIVYTYDDNGVTKKELVIVSVKNDKVYYLLYTAETYAYLRFLPIIQNMINTFKINSDIESSNAIIQNTVNENHGLLAYHNFTYGINMQYPSNWEKTEDATINLFAPYEEGSSQFREYRLAIDVISVYDTHTDYYLKYIWNGIGNQTWRRTVEQFSPTTTHVVLSKQDNYTSFFGNDDGYGYVKFSLGLGSISYPASYNVLSSVYDDFTRNGYVCTLTDFINWISLPPPKYNTTITPSSLIIKPGRQNILN
jgi:hypothetical protein